MKIDIETNVPIPSPGPDMVENVYPVRGGFSARNGEIVGANNYGLHYFDTKVPMAKVDGPDWEAAMFAVGFMLLVSFFAAAALVAWAVL